MNKFSLKKNWIYGLLILSIISSVIALQTDYFIYKSGSAGIGIIILLILILRKTKLSSDIWYIILAFLFSIIGDWFMSHKGGDAMMFSKGIAAFFVAHVGYLWFAIANGKINWKITSIVLLLFIIYFFWLLYPAIPDQVLMIAALIYLLISCVTFGASFGIKGNAVFKWSYVFGVFLIVFSDTIISFTEFLGYGDLDFLILPTYYLAHISITFALIQRMQLEENKKDINGE